MGKSDLTPSENSETSEENSEDIDFMCESGAY